MESSLYTAAFWRAAAERAIKTAAQSAILAAGADSLAANAFTLPWVAMGGLAAGGFVLSVLTSIVSGISSGGSPSLTNAEVLPPQ